jgi:hypothetical protein
LKVLPGNSSGWADSLQNSEIKGQRYLTDKSRRAEQDKRSREEFVKELRQIQMENIAKARKSEESSD